MTTQRNRHQFLKAGSLAEGSVRMQSYHRHRWFLLLGSLAVLAPYAPRLAAQEKASDWPQFRGSGGLGVSQAKGLPVTWSAAENVVWKTELPGPGASSPIVVGERVFVTCYSGYGIDPKEPGDPANLKRHLLCLSANDAKLLWQRAVAAKLPEAAYTGFIQRHGYASSTPASDGERVFCLLGKSGVFAFDLNGEQLWQADVGAGTHQWGGAGASPIVYRDLVIVNASIESESLVALDRRTGKEVWRAGGIREAWDTPHIVELPGGGTELVISVYDRVLGFDPTTGKQLWNCDVLNKHNANPSPVVHDGVLYCLLSGPQKTSFAIRAGGRGDVTGSHVVWKLSKSANVSSPIYHDGHLYFANEQGVAYCLDARTGAVVYEERLTPRPAEFYASPVLADGKLYYVSRQGRTYVLAAKAQFEQAAVNELGDASVFNASPAVSGDRLLLRSDRCLYCIGKE